MKKTKINTPKEQLTITKNCEEMRIVYCFTPDEWEVILNYYPPISFKLYKRAYDICAIKNADLEKDEYLYSMKLCRQKIVYCVRENIKKIKKMYNLD